MYLKDSIVEVIREGEIVRVSESQAIEEDLFILRKIIEPEREHVPDFTSKQAKERRVVKSYSNLESWRAGKVSYKRNRVIEDLVDNFHWEIVRVRRHKGLTRKQLAEAVGVSEEDFKVIEFGGELPKDDFVLINKVENYLGINLRKEKKKDEVTLLELQKMDEKKIQEQIEKAHLKDANLEQEEERISGSDIEVLEG